MTDKSNAVNLYGVIDRELERMHQLLHQESMVYNKPSSYQMGGGMHSNAEYVYRRIERIQEVLLEALVSHDSAVQEKVAELALMDKGE